MKRIKVRLKERSYDILIGKRIISRAGTFIRAATSKEDAIIITNPHIATWYAAPLKKALKNKGLSYLLLTIPPSERAKSLYYVNRLLKRIAQIAKAKKPFIIALGGGVVGDVAGFLASIYKRGIPYVQIPTTLLAQIDSSIGGKTAVDLSLGKNIVGSFYQPALVLSDISFLKSLPEKEIISGIAEMIKYAIIKDAKLFSYLEANFKSLLALKPAVLLPAISRCAQIKADIVSKDEKERKGLRTILNFGHTVGHAVETVSKYRYNHGEAISLGMLAALKIAVSLNLINLKIYERVFRLIKNCHLPTKIKGIDKKKLLKTIYFDKKFLGRRNRFVLPRKIGKVFVKENIKERIIAQALT